MVRLPPKARQFWPTYERLGVHIAADAVTVIRTASRIMIRPESRFRRDQRAARHSFFRHLLACHRYAAALAAEFRL